MIGCKECGEKVLARQLCQKHYSRMKRSGRLDRVNVQRTGKCSIEGCDRLEHSRGLCGRHYQQGAHPLKHAWKQLRSRYPGQFDTSWERFDQFIADIKEKPHPKSQLRRGDVSRIWSKDNVHWTVPVVRPDALTPAARKAYSKAWNLRDRFGLSSDDFAAMLAGQNKRCGICGALDGAKKDKLGRDMSLHVDHNHKTGKVRALLCARCNLLVGSLDEDAELARKVAQYIEWHNGPEFRCDVP